MIKLILKFGLAALIISGIVRVLTINGMLTGWWYGFTMLPRLVLWLPFPKDAMYCNPADVAVGFICSALMLVSAIYLLLRFK